MVLFFLTTSEINSLNSKLNCIDLIPPVYSNNRTTCIRFLKKNLCDSTNLNLTIIPILHTDMRTSYSKVKHRNSGADHNLNQRMSEFLISM